MNFKTVGRHDTFAVVACPTVGAGTATAAAVIVSAVLSRTVRRTYIDTFAVITCLAGVAVAVLGTRAAVLAQNCVALIVAARHGALTNARSLLYAELTFSAFAVIGTRVAVLALPLVAIIVATVAALSVAAPIGAYTNASVLYAELA